MSDVDLRELERRWHTTGSVADEAVYLRERARVGDLTPVRLELAAYCGHEASLLITNRSRSLESGWEADLEIWSRWCEGLGGWGREVCVRGAVAASAFAVNEAARSGRDVAHLLRLLDQVRGWLLDPTEETRETIRYLSRVAWPPTADPVALSACWAAEGLECNEATWGACLYMALAYAVQTREALEGRREAALIFGVVQAELITWALRQRGGTASLPSR